jgi:predicted PurR-regulated permease PerM
MTDKTNQLTPSSDPQRTLFTVITAFVVLLGLGVLAWMLRDLLAPVFMGLLLALIFNPVLNWTQRNWRLPRLLTLTLLLLLLAGIVTGLAAWLLPMAYQQISQLLTNLPAYIQELLDLIPGEKVTLSGKVKSALTEAAADPQRIVSLFLQGTITSFGIITHTFSLSTYITIYVIMFIIFFITFSLRMSDIADWIIQFLPHSEKEQILNTLQKIFDAAGDFLRIRLIIALILGILFSIGWAIVGVPYWLLLGLGSGILSIIPYAAALGWLAALLINAFEAHSPVTLLYALFWPSLVYFIIQLFEGWLLTPYLQGEKLHIHPVVVLFVVFAGGVLAQLSQLGG